MVDLDDQHSKLLGGPAGLAAVAAAVRTAQLTEPCPAPNGLNRCLQLQSLLRSLLQL